MNYSEIITEKKNSNPPVSKSFTKKREEEKLKRDIQIYLEKGGKIHKA